jgi:CPA2 family monovalent cation:H+ antiporter-2
MPHSTPLIATIVAGLGLAFLLGILANRFKLSPLLGYLLAGVVIGPFTPGYVADQHLATELAEIGVILLMFGVGLHFSLADLLAVRAIAVPGAIGQIAVATALGMGLGWLMGWPLGGGFVFGLALSVAITVVMLRALQDQRIIETERGRIAVGWLIVEDLAMVLALVLLPAIARLLGGSSAAEPPPEGALAALFGARSIEEILLVTVLKVASFVAVMLIIGRRVIPWVLHYVAHTGSRELFRLSVLAIALGVAFGAAALFGVSFALGAFFAGMILAESRLSHQAAQETLPLRDAFAVLFFVSVGMLFNPAIVVEQPLHVVATVLIIIVGKSAAAYLIMRAFRHDDRAALTISASLAQIGEFSFILAGLGVSLGLLSEEGRALILAGALISILVNPILFFLLGRLHPREGPEGDAAEARVEPQMPLERSSLTGHAVLIGYGRVGSLVGADLLHRGQPFLVIEEDRDILARLAKAGVASIAGNASAPGLLDAANIAQARWLVSAIPNPFEAGTLVEQARAANPAIETIARAHSEAEVDYLRSLGTDVIIMGETEIAKAMTARIAAGLAEGP